MYTTEKTQLKYFLPPEQNKATAFGLYMFQTKEVTIFWSLLLGPTNILVRLF